MSLHNINFKRGGFISDEIFIYFTHLVSTIQRQNPFNERKYKGARTEKAGLPVRATGTNLLPELRYINKSSAH